MSTENKLLTLITEIKGLSANAKGYHSRGMEISALECIDLIEKKIEQFKRGH
jgi:hypothetical protein